MRNRDEVVKKKKQRHLFNVLDIGFHADGTFALQALRRHNLGAMHGHPFLTRPPSHLGHPIRVVVCLGSRAGGSMLSPILFFGSLCCSTRYRDTDKISILNSGHLRGRISMDITRCRSRESQARAKVTALGKPVAQPASVFGSQSWSSPQLGLTRLQSGLPLLAQRSPGQLHLR